MTFDTVWLVYGAVFLTVLLLCQGLYHLHAAGRAGGHTLARRLRRPVADGPAAEAPRSVRRRPRDRLAPLGPWRRGAERLDRLIRQSGLAVSARWLAGAMAALALAAFVASLALLMALNATEGAGLAATLAAAVGLGVGAAPLVCLRRRRARRLGRLAEQLPEALDVMVRSLRAGHPVGTAMMLVGRELPDPIGNEFALVVDETTYGLELREALANLGARVDLADLRYVVVAINLQHETGGNLVEVLDQLAGVIRARQRMARKIRALSAEARLSARMLAAMPVVFGALVFAANPEFYLEVAHDPLFVPVLGSAFALELVGVYVMYRLVRFRV